MLEGIPWELITDLTPAAIVSIAVLLLMLGGLYPKRTVDALERQKEYWREAAEKQRETVQVQAQTISKQEIVSDTIAKVMDAVQDANRRDGGGHP